MRTAFHETSDNIQTNQDMEVLIIGSARMSMVICCIVASMQQRLTAERA
jgi:hypothetical protein